MAKETKKNNKNMIIGICCAVVVVIVVIVACVLATSGNKLDDSYFVSDGSKYVITMESDDLEVDEGEEAYVPAKTHVVYTYSGDEITGMKTYAEYADADLAQKAFDAMVAAGEDMEGIVVDGKYIVKTNPAEDYQDMTASDVKSYIDMMESLKNMDLTDGSDTEEEAVEVEEEVVEE